MHLCIGPWGSYAAHALGAPVRGVCIRPDFPSAHQTALPTPPQDPKSRVVVACPIGKTLADETATTLGLALCAYTVEKYGAAFSPELLSQLNATRFRRRVPTCA